MTKLARCLIGVVATLFAVGAGCAVDDRGVDVVSAPNGAGGPDGGDAGSPSVVGPEGMAGNAGAGDGDAAPRLELSTASVDLGPVTLGFPSRARITIRNAGEVAVPAPGMAWTAESDPDFALVQNRCADEVLPGARCDVRVQFLPSRAGSARATLQVSALGSVAGEVRLAGLGVVAGPLIVTPAAGGFEDFGPVPLGSTVQGAFLVSNRAAEASGPIRLTVNRSEFRVLSPDEPAEADAPASDECQLGASLSNGESCLVRVALTPTERGPLEATMTATSEGAGSVSVTLTGRGLLAGTLGVSSTVLDFGGVVPGVDGAAVRHLRMDNQGDQALTLAGLKLEPADSSSFSILDSECGAGSELAGGQACTVQIEFRPPEPGLESAAELVVEAAEGEQRRTIALRGVSLVPGSLLVEPATEGARDFGEVLLGQSEVRTFRVENPSAQPSGVLSLQASNGFQIATPPEAGECVEGSTSLADGERCIVRVSFTPVRREPSNGSLTVSSSLAGAQSLGLTARGVVTARLEVEDQVDFGRVATSESSQRTVVVRNAGDRPLPPPELELSGSSGFRAEAFSFESGCTQPLAFAEECQVVITFAPGRVEHYWATLELRSEPGGQTSVLLLAEALEPGSLVLAVADDGSADFGDVELGSTATRTFTLDNPGSAASGRLSILTDDSRFSVDGGDCSADTAEGLASGDSCTFSVRFTPDGSDPLEARLTVRSTDAGESGLEIRGRGRTAARLAATAERNLGRANLGEDALTQPTNQFTWTIQNTGDLPTGPLQVQSDNPTEFQVTGDGCDGARVEGKSSCQMTIRFRPDDSGTRSGEIVVTDTETGSSVAISLSGLGVRLAQPGESCVNAECVSGVCTGGTCCDRACNRTCQSCSSTGTCIDQDDGQQCGNGGAVCFGVDRCLLPDGQPCGNGGDCGSGNCETRLGSSNPSADRICCEDDCSSSGQECNAQGRCQDPTLGEGAACGSGQLPCESGLQCKQCRNENQSRCTPTNACCGGCAAGYACVNGTCGCPQGGAQIDCGGGLCIANQANVCCPDSPSCPNALPFCDRQDNRCKECLTDSQCPGANRVCSGNSCTCSGCQIGATCFAPGGVNPNNPCQVCSPFSSSTSFSPNVGATCGSAPTACSGQDTCSAAGACQRNDFAPGLACPNGQCNGAGACQPLPNPFSCSNANPPRTQLAFNLLSRPSGQPPAPRGGTVRNGRYAPSRIDVYGSDVAPAFAVNEPTFEFRDGFVQIGYQIFIGTGAVLGSPEVQFVGSFTAAGTSLRFDVQRCDTANLNVPSPLSYTATVNNLVTIQPASDGSTVVITYDRQ